MKDLEESLRAELRLHRLVLAGTTALVAGLLLTGAANPATEELRARRLTLLGATGEPVAVLEGNPAGGLRLLPPAGGSARAIELSLAGEGPALGLRDDSGALRAAATVQSRGSGFVLLDPGGKTRAEMRTIGGNAEFFLRDPEGKARVGAGALKQSGGIQVFDGTAPRATLEVAQGRARVLLAGPDGVTRVLVQAGSAGETGIQLRDVHGRPFWGELEKEPGAGHPPLEER